MTSQQPDAVLKRLPTVVASPTGDVAIALLEFDDAQPIPNRDATGFYYSVQRAPDDSRSRLAVLFSGTVFYVKTDAFDLPPIEDKEIRFRVFAEAAIGDFVTEHGLPDDTPSGVPATKVECFSPHFQSWQDRRPASDDAIETYLAAHLMSSWRFSLEGWELGLADSLRLHQPIKTIRRLVSLGEGVDWTVTPRPPHGLWLKPTPAFLRKYRTVRRASAPPKEPTMEPAEMGTSTPPEFVYVDEARIADLRRVALPQHDLRKLIAICEELNLTYRSQCYHAVAALTRALIDHVPPLLGCRTFAEVANNYQGGKSFKDCMLRLDGAARSIADMHLHTVVRQAESLPTRTQVNFSNEVDVLLAEIVRKAPPWSS